MLRSQSANGSRRGVVLLAVLIVIVVLSLAAYKYNDWMASEYRAADSAVRASQARAFAMSGVHFTAALLASNADDLYWDNTDSFQNVAVPSSDQKARAGRFSVLALQPPAGSQSDQSYRFGIIDESSKINLNALLLLDKGKGDVGKQILMGLPNMTEDVANAILDWLDPDDTPRTGGAENDYYSGLNPPYRCKNGPFDSLEELLLVKGVTPQLLFGNDRNRNGILDPDEDDGSGQVDQGWSAYLTVYSREINVGSDGMQRLNVNDQDMQGLLDKLKGAVDEQLAYFLIAYRLYGDSNGSSSGGQSPSKGSTPSKGGAPASGGSTGAMGTTSAKGSAMPTRTGPTTGGTPSSSGGQAGKGGQSSQSQPPKGGQTTQTQVPVEDPAAVQAKVDQDLADTKSQKQGKQIKSLWDLMNAKVSVQVGDDKNKRTVTFTSPLKDAGQQRDLLPKLLDLCSTSAQLDQTPRININTASQAVLTTLIDVGGLQDVDVQSIVSRRPSPGSMTDTYKTAAWLLTDLQLPASTLKKLDPYITTRSWVYRFQSVGYFEDGGPTARVEAVVDSNLGRPRIVYFRDLSELGKGFNVGGEMK